MTDTNTHEGPSAAVMEQARRAGLKRGDSFSYVNGPPVVPSTQVGIGGRHGDSGALDDIEDAVRALDEGDIEIERVLEITRQALNNSGRVA